MAEVPAAQGRPRLTLFDLDHTLLDGDSDVLWCEFLMGRGVLDRAAFATSNNDMERAYKAGSASAADFCGFYAATLAGRSAQAWAPLRQAYMDEVIAPRIPAAAQALVQGHIDGGDLVVLTTGSNRFLVELTAARLGFAHLIATECELGEQGFTGRVRGTPNLRQGKVTRLQAWLGERGQRLADFESCAYSDSINDLPLLEAVQHAVVVHPDDQLAAIAAQRAWPVMNLRAAPA